MRQLTPADRDELRTLDAFAFVDDPTRVSAERAVEGIDFTRTFGAVHEDVADRLAGIYTSYDLRLRVPGAVSAGGTSLVAMNGLSWVCVHPDMRRRGVLRTMIRHHLQDARDRGDAIAGLHASEPAIYGRFGYAVASHDISYSLGRGTEFTVGEAAAASADATAVSTLFDLDDDETARRVHEIDLASPDLGTVVVRQEMVRARLRDTPSARVGKEPRRALIATRDGRDVGVAVFSRTVSWEDGSPDGTVRVHHLTALDAGAMLALGRRLVDMDLMRRIDLIGRGLDDLLLSWAGSIRSRRVTVGDGLWLRPVDLAGMLTSRGYAAPLDLVVEVRDETCEWNSGSWRLVVDDGGNAECERARTEPDLQMDVDVIGEVFLGLRRVSALFTHGRVDERTPGSVAALTRAFATDVHPICGTGF